MCARKCKILHTPNFVQLLLQLYTYIFCFANFTKVQYFCVNTYQYAQHLGVSVISINFNFFANYKISMSIYFVL